ncbi:hypothetical protein Tco_1458107 [Tanacetum coccineum]
MATMAKNVIVAGPFQFKKEIIVPATEGIPEHKRPQELKDLTLKEKFTPKKRESIHSYYLRYAKLINDMNIIGMTMKPIQINTKFVNPLQPEWSRFVTAAKQAKDLHKVNFDQLYAYLKQNENEANEVRAMRHIYPDPLALLANTYNPPPSYSS